MEIRTLGNIPVREQGGEKRLYHLFDKVEVIITHVPAGHIQPYHRHEEISELYYVIEGTVIAHEGNDSWTIAQGESFLLSPSMEYHTVSNPTDTTAILATVKLKPAEDSCPELFKRDKQAKD